MVNVRNYMRRYVRHGDQKKGLVIGRYDGETNTIVMGFSLKSSKDVNWNAVSAEDFALLRMKSCPIRIAPLNVRGVLVVTEDMRQRIFDTYIRTYTPELNVNSRNALYNTFTSLVSDICMKPNRSCHVPKAAVLA